jgi:hypothetical protein
VQLVINTLATKKLPHKVGIERGRQAIATILIKREKIRVSWR